MRRFWKDNGWRKRFAFFPLFLRDGPDRCMVWWEPYWSQFMGEYCSVRLTDPAEDEKEQGTNT